MSIVAISIVVVTPMPTNTAIIFFLITVVGDMPESGQARRDGHGVVVAHINCGRERRGRCQPHALKNGGNTAVITVDWNPELAQSPSPRRAAQATESDAGEQRHAKC
jgi:hypothetical protein